MRPAQGRRRAAARRRRAATAVVALALVAAVVLITLQRTGASRLVPSPAAPGHEEPAGGRAATSGRGAPRPPGTSTTTPTTTTSTAAPVPGAATPADIGTTALSLSEPVAGGSTRPLPTAVRYPALGPPGRAPTPGAVPDRRGAPYPLVVFSGGFDIGAEAFATLLDRWSAAGYVVADPTYPFTDPSSPEGLDESDIVHHPTDLRFVVSSLLALSAGTGTPLSGLVDPNRIAVAGQSDGGDVTLATALNTCCRDQRVKAAMVLSGAQLAAFGGTYSSSAGVPLLVTQGSADTVNPPACSVALYDGAGAPKYYLDIVGAEHTPPYLVSGPAQSTVAAVTTDFLDGYLKGSPAARTALPAAGDVPGVSDLRTGPTVPPVMGGCPGAPAG